MRYRMSPQVTKQEAPSVTCFHPLPGLKSLGSWRPGGECNLKARGINTWTRSIHKLGLAARLALIAGTPEAKVILSEDPKTIPLLLGQCKILGTLRGTEGGDLSRNISYLDFKGEIDTDPFAPELCNQAICYPFKRVRDPDDFVIWYRILGNSNKQSLLLFGMNNNNNNKGIACKYL